MVCVLSEAISFEAIAPIWFHVYENKKKCKKKIKKKLKFDNFLDNFGRYPAQY